MAPEIDGELRPRHGAANIGSGSDVSGKTGSCDDGDIEVLQIQSHSGASDQRVLAPRLRQRKQLRAHEARSKTSALKGASGVPFGRAVAGELEAKLPLRKVGGRPRG